MAAFKQVFFLLKEAKEKQRVYKKITLLLQERLS